ncbi:MAG: phage portal protein [Acidimicrobiales bacterium]|nr:phage portal protein [Acidimicrobiales bacterium]
MAKAKKARARTAQLETTPTPSPAAFDALFGPRGGGWDGGDLAGLYGPLFGPGGPVDWLVERIGTADRCLQLVCQQLASMVVRMRPHTATWRAWLGNPDPAYLNGLSEAVFQMTWSTYARGETFLWVTSRYADGYPASFVVLDPTTMDVNLDDDGALTYKSNSYVLDPADVLWIRRNPGIGPTRGRGALSSYWSSLASAWASERHAATVLDNSGVPGAVLKHPRVLTQDQADELQAAWVRAVRSRMGAPAILSGGLDYEVLSWSPKDLMLLELREYDAKQIAAAFGVPAFLVNLPQADGLNYSNPAQLFRLWWQTELMPATRRFEVGLSTWLPSGTSIEFDPRVLLRPDFGEQVRWWVELLKAGVVTEDEVREAVLDLPPSGEDTLGLLDSGPPGQQSGSALVDPRIPIEPPPMGPEVPI